MHIFYINILIFNFDVFNMFQNRGFIFKKTVCRYGSITLFYLLDCSGSKHVEDNKITN
jgi:hypothetical protein